jgi:hypothetical protein
MSRPYTRASLYSASHVSGLYSAQIDCRSSANTRIFPVGGNHVQNTYWGPMWCISSSNTLISSLSAIPYSAQIVFRSSANTRIFWVGGIHLWSPNLVEISCMLNANTQILSLGESGFQVLFITGRLYVKFQNTAFSCSNSCFETIFSMTFANIRISSLVKSHVSRQFSVQIRCKLTVIKRI